jgi:hypothetical protein
MPNRCVYCPNLLWKMRMGSGKVFSFPAECKNYKFCQSCAERRTEREIDWACKMFWRQPKVWVSVVPYDEAITRRIGRRRTRMGGGGTYWVHRSDTNTLHIYSSLDLSATKRRTGEEPTNGQWMLPMDAARHLIGQSLHLPGIEGWLWTGGWKRPTETPPPPRTFDLGENPPEVAEPALVEAEARLDDLMGPGALDRLTPHEVEFVWLPLVRECIDQQWAIKRGRATDG